MGALVTAVAPIASGVATQLADGVAVARGVTSSATSCSATNARARKGGAGGG